MKTENPSTENPERPPGVAAPVTCSAPVRPTDQPRNLVDWLWYVRRYENGIFVRELKADGKWGNVALSELTPERWANYVARWLDDGHIPCRVREDDEIKNAQRPNDALCDGGP